MSEFPTRNVSNPADLAHAARLLVDFNAEYDDPAPELAWLAEHLTRLVAGGDTSVLLAGHPGVGVAVLRFRTSLWEDAAEAYLAEFYVQPAHRGRGIGTAFLDDAIAHARERGATYMDLNTSDDDEAAIHVYERRGFDCHEGRGEGPKTRYYELELT